MPWARAFDACVSCGKADKPHHAHGLCPSCYNKSYDKHYREIHRDIKREQDHAWRQENVEKCRAYRARWVNAHPESVELKRQRSARWYAQNKDLARARRQAWQQTNPERWQALHNANGIRRRYRLQATRVERVSLIKVAQRDRMVCGICHKKVERIDLSFDHIVPLSKGGPHVEWNLQPAHLFCNQSRGAGRLPVQMRLAV